MRQIRALTEKDMTACHALINFAFQRSVITEEPLVEAEPDRIWGCFCEGELASTVIVLPHVVMIHGVTHRLGLIAGVASWPEHRRGGNIAALLVHTLSVMREQGHTISYLVPFAYSFYRKYGWEMTHDYKKYTVPSEYVPAWSGRGRIKRMQQPDIGLLHSLYEQYAAKFNGMLKRDERHWKRKVLTRKKGQIVVYRNSGDEPKGYMIYEDQGNELTVHEMVYLDQDAQKGLWEHIRMHEGMYRSVTFTAPADDPFAFLIENPKSLETRQMQHLMSRIIDVQAFLLRYPFASTKDKSLFISVSDPFADWNHGTFRIKLDLIGEHQVSRIAKHEAPAGAAECDIQTFTAMMLGYKSARFLHAAGRLRGGTDAVDQWQSSIPVLTNFYLDFGY